MNPRSDIFDLLHDYSELVAECLVDEEEFSEFHSRLDYDGSWHANITDTKKLIAGCGKV